MELYFIKNSKVTLELAGNISRKFTIKLNKVRKETNKSEEQKEISANINRLYNAQQSVIDLFNYYNTIESEASYRATKGEEIRILASKQMLQTLSIAFYQVKVGNTSEGLLYQIRQTFYCFYQAKEITRKNTLI